MEAYSNENLENILKVDHLREANELNHIMQGQEKELAGADYETKLAAYQRYFHRIIEFSPHIRDPLLKIKNGYEEVINGIVETLAKQLDKIQKEV